MTSQPMSIDLHRASDDHLLTVTVDHIYYFKALTYNRAPLTTVVMASGREVVRESVVEIQRRCLGC